MKRLALLTAGAALAGLTACTSSAPSAAPSNGPTVTSSPAATSSRPVITASCRQRYHAWKQGPGKGLVAALDAVGSSATAGDTNALKAALKRTKPLLAKAARYPLPACADPEGYWTVLMMHVNAAATSTGSAATLTAAMKGVPTLTRELNAELKRAE
jgi:hypothetical protein